MDLRKVKNEEKLAVCRKYYLAGFFVLPFMWFINSVWFFNDAFRKSPFTEQPQIRSYVIRSIIGTILWMSILITWQVIYQIKRADWGEVGEDLTLVIPAGIK